MVENSSTIGHRLMMRLALGVWLTISFGASAEESYRKNAGDYTVYLTVMPAEIVRGPLSEESAGRSAEPARTARDTHEVIVAIFDVRSMQRLTGMEVKASVTAPGFPGERRDLEPISVAGRAAYGNMFPMLGRGPFRIEVEFRAHYGPHEQRATFYFTHPSFELPKKSKGET